MKYRTSTECTWLYLFESKLQSLLPQADSGHLQRVTALPPQADVFDRGRQCFGLVLLAVRQNLRGIVLQAVIIEYAAVRGRI